MAITNSSHSRYKGKYNNDVYNDIKGPRLVGASISTTELKYMPEPYRIRVVEPIEQTTRAQREEALVKVGFNPFLLNSKDVFVDLLTDSGTGGVTQSMQAAMLLGDESYSGSRSYYALSDAVQNIFGYQLTIPTHQGRGAEQLYVPSLIKKREREKGLLREKMTVISNFSLIQLKGIHSGMAAVLLMFQLNLHSILQSKLISRGTLILIYFNKPLSKLGHVTSLISLVPLRAILLVASQCRSKI